MQAKRILVGAAIAAALSAAAVSVPTLALEQFTAAQVAARTGAADFEFRSRTQVWRFAADGRVAAEYTSTRMTLGGFGETFGLKAGGTWRREGDRLCVAWPRGGPAPSGCYAVMPGRGSMVYLAGPQLIEGSLEAAPAAPATGVAVRPAPQPRPFGR